MLLRKDIHIKSTSNSGLDQYCHCCVWLLGKDAPFCWDFSCYNSLNFLRHRKCCIYKHNGENLPIEFQLFCNNLSWFSSKSVQNFCILNLTVQIFGRCFSNYSYYRLHIVLRQHFSVKFWSQVLLVYQAALWKYTYPPLFYYFGPRSNNT